MSSQKIAWILPFLGDLKQVARSHGLEALATDLDGLITRHGDEILAADAESRPVVLSTAAGPNVVSFSRRAGVAGKI